MKTQLCILFASVVSLAVTAAHAAPGNMVLGGGTGTIGDASAEDWKGRPDPAEVHFGALSGLGILDNKGGLAIVGTASKKILDQGWATDINNSVSLELQAGPLFVSGGTAFFYSTHLRWDFVKDTEWTFYGLGGLAGNVTGDSLDNRFELFPRFGIGSFWSVSDFITLRGEVSHELTAVGVVFPL